VVNTNEVENMKSMKSMKNRGSLNLGGVGDSETPLDPQKWGFFIGGYRGRHPFGTRRHGRENACIRKLSFCQLREYGAENVWGNVGGSGA
jgi:hypothetical protein